MRRAVAFDRTAGKMKKNDRCFRLALVMLLCLATARCQAQQTAPRRLTLKESIDLALKNNLGVLLAGAQVDEAEGTRERRLSALLPRASGTSLADFQSRNLAVSGISFPGLPTVVGPFAFYDFRVAASQAIFDRQAFHDWKASIQLEQSARQTYQDTRDLVIRQAARLYLDSESAAATVAAAESRVASSETLEKLALDQRAHGLATGVDVARAQVRLARDRQRLLVARNNYQTSLLALARFLGLDLRAPVEPAGQLQFHRLDAPDLDEALRTALQSRPDYRALMAQRDSLAEQQRANRARYLPKLSVNGNYGAIGRTFGSLPATGELQGVLSISLFDRDRNGQQKELASRMKRLTSQMDDLARGIEQELRKALLDLQSAEELVKVADSALALSETELKLAEDRFRNGVGDNVEVVLAQDALAAAQDDRIVALAQHADAGMALARALGATESNYLKYLGEP